MKHALASSVAHLLVALAACHLLGCQAPAPPTAKTRARVVVQGTDGYDRLWESATDVLRAHYLRPDWQDRSRGIITTYAETSPQAIEFWRPFPTDEHGWWESNLQTVRRRATMHIDRTDEPDEYELTMEVDVERFSTPERQVTSPAAALQLYTLRLPTTEGRLLTEEEAEFWIPIGRDPIFEEALLSRILSRYGGQAEREFGTTTATQPAGVSPSD